MESLEGRLTPTAVFNINSLADVYATGQRNALVVDRIYSDLLGRSGSPVGPDPGPAYWAGQLEHGVSRQKVALSIMSDGGGEYDDQLVNTAFQRYLHRDAEPQALDYFATLLNQGLTVEQLDIDLVSSQEYFNDRGGGMNEGFLNAVYEDALGRSSDSAGVSAFEGFLAAGGSRTKVADLVFGSPEYRDDLVQSVYESLLGRVADPAGLTAFTAELSSGLTDQQVMAQIIGSDEFAALA